jgi:hypothetical protein
LEEVSSSPSSRFASSIAAFVQRRSGQLDMFDVVEC